jgi:hypothetical protein
VVSGRRLSGMSATEYPGIPFHRSRVIDPVGGTGTVVGGTVDGGDVVGGSVVLVVVDGTSVVVVVEGAPS